MFAKRIVVPLSVLAVGGTAAVAGVLHADAAEVTACSVAYSVPNQWGSGFTGGITIRNSGGTDIEGWSLGFGFPSGQRLAGGWNGVFTQDGTRVTVTDVGWNRSIAPGGQVTVGFNGVWSGTNTSPTTFTVNGAICTGGATPSTTPSTTPTTAPAATRSATPAATKSATPAATGSATPAAPATTGPEDCTDFAALVSGKYWVNNNVWGKADGTGSQCVRQNGLTDASLSWDTRWTWAGDNTKVKSYASAVLGWHWGWKVPSGTGLPVRLSEGKAVETNWDFTVTQESGGVMNVAYDLWLHDRANPDWQDNPTDEVMVWLYKSGGAGPIGTKQATVTIGGATWDLYRGNIGWEVYSFVRTGDTSSARLDLTGFTDELTARGWLAKTKYLSSVQAGTEVFTGSGRLETSAYSVRIG
ncbi:MAG TPA: cellulose binding domain-containing protein [Actinoplanes sp.]|nr:cellulose binding domain-containing protein [Actinoplanes sp.]